MITEAMAITKQTQPFGPNLGKIARHKHPCKCLAPGVGAEDGCPIMVPSLSYEDW